MSHITALDTLDLRFPTSLFLDGSDAMNPDPDYSAAYVVASTDDAHAPTGHGFAFTIGRGNDVQVAAIEALRPYVVGQEVEPLLADLGGLWRRLVHDSQLRWLGPEKGVMHMAVGAVVNALWDLRAKREGKPLWKLLSDLPPDQIVDLADFRYLTDALDAATPRSPSGSPRSGWPPVSTSPTGWCSSSCCRSGAPRARRYVRQRVPALAVLRRAEIRGPPHPQLDAGHVQRRPRPRHFGVARGQRLDDGPVLGDGPCHCLILGDASPHPCPGGVAGQALQQPGQVAVAGRAVDEPVELHVVGDQLVHVVRPLGGLHQFVEPPYGLGVHLGSGQLHCGRLQDSPDLQQLQHRALLVQVDDERQRLQQQVRLEAGDVRAVALADVQHPDQGQRLDRLTQRVSGQPQPLSQLLLRRQPVARVQFPGNDHVLELLDRVVRHGHAIRFSRISEAKVHTNVVDRSDELLISLSTVKSHLSAIQARLGVRNRVEIAAWAWQNRIVHAE